MLMTTFILITPFNNGKDKQLKSTSTSKNGLFVNCCELDDVYIFSTQTYYWTCIAFLKSR